MLNHQHKYFSIFLLFAYLLSMLSVPALADEEPASRLVFATGAYKNNTHQSEILSIPDADALDVVVSGRTEKKFRAAREVETRRVRIPDRPDPEDQARC
ncbi:MAG: hypothetical protein AAF512_10355, partial [Pseudomonadota bacterium]